MRKFERYLVVTITMIMIFMANTVSATFHPTNLKGVQNTVESSKYGDSLSKLSESNSNSFSSFKEIKNEGFDGNFLNFWNSNTLTSKSSFGDVKSYSDFAFTDADSMQLVIGVDTTYQTAYNNLMYNVGKIQGKVVNTISIKGQAIAIVVDVPLTDVSFFLNSLQGNNVIRYVEPNKKFEAQLVPNDPNWTVQWGPSKIQADYAWNTTTGDSSVLVAVIDTGIAYTHPDLVGNYVALGYNWVSDNNDPLDDNGHGTHCAGIVAATLNNALGIAGLAQVRIMAEKGLDAGGSGYEDDLANAIIDAVNKGAKILSNSWGAPMESMLIHEAIQYAYSNGVLVLAAAGNSATDTKFYPAAYDEVVAITATDSLDNPASFTNYGDWVEVAAPGVNIYSTLPPYHVTLNDPPYSRNQNYDYLSGTSMACPHAAGVAALIWSQFPNASRDWVRAQLRTTAEDKGDVGFDVYYGYGRINAKNAVEQTPPDHDLQVVDVAKPRYVQPGDVASLNVTVLNFGASNEENVTVQLFIDGSLTDSGTISYLANLTSATVSLLWNPLAEGTYNATFNVIPVAGETNIENNVMTEMILVRYIIGHVLFDQTRNEPIEWYSEWVANLTDKGYAVDTYSAGYITLDALSGYDIFVIPAAVYPYLSDEITAIQDFVMSGGGLLVIGDYDSSIYTSLTSFAGITWVYSAMWFGIADDITPHEVTEGVSEALFGNPLCRLYVNSPAADLIRDPYGEVMLAVSEMGAGRVIGISDQQTVADGYIEYADNLQLANNMIDWLLGAAYEHELVVRLDAPSYLMPGESTQLNATVFNTGLENETNVQLKLLIDSVIKNSATIPLLESGKKYTINYMWAPTVEAIYNVTAYAPPVTGENITLDNVKTKFVTVHYPLINPQPGQYAKYLVNLYDSFGDILDYLYLNLTYEYYVEPHEIYVSLWEKYSDGTIATGWMIVNTINRFVETGVWSGLWYPGWIETDLHVGSSINLLDGLATVNGSRIIMAGPRLLDCWEIPISTSGLFYDMCYDKASGLWTYMSIDISSEREVLLLIDTNIPVGTAYDHELGVTLDVLTRLKPGEASVINATVYNLGLSNETDVEIQILINSTKVASATIDLDNGTWFTISYYWMPPGEGNYNVTAYAPPVSGETVVINNVVSKIAIVRTAKVALISAYSELTIIAPMLESMGLGCDIYNDNNVLVYTGNLSLLLNYRVVIFYNRYRHISSSEFSALETYVSSGGTLLITGFDSLVSDALLANLIRSSLTGDDVGQGDLIVTDNMHPITNGPYGSFPAGYHIYGLYSDCDVVKADTVRGAVTVAELADGFDKIIATEGLPGKVVFWNGDGTYDWLLSGDCQIMLKNLIHWFLLRYDHELEVSLQAPAFLEPGTSAMLNATVKNIGINDEYDVYLQLSANGTVVENVTISLLSSGTSYTMNYIWTPSVAGKYNITAYAPPISGENMTENNIYSELVYVQYAPRILAYVQFTDYFSDYMNTLSAINSTFGPNYILTELLDYTQLDSMLQGKDILLIPDQENAFLSTMETIGEAWTDTLNEFLGNGGTIILCDGGTGFGTTYGILTGAGLMQIQYTNYRSFYTLHVADSSDPLAKGVSTSFTAPFVTVSYATDETNVVINDGTDPVVIHKKVSEGHIALLGFDFELPDVNTAQIIGNAVKLGLRITISTNLTIGSSGTELRINGTKATPNGIVSIYWDDDSVGNTTANGLGNFEYLLTVPQYTSAGAHQIKAVDIATNRKASILFRVIQIVLNPAKGPIGTKVTIYGSSFLPSIQASVTFNDIPIGYANVDSFGNFTFTLNIPLSDTGSQTIKAYETGSNYAFATFTVVDVTPLDVAVDVGAIHFLGEVAEFYTQVAFKGIAVNATSLNAILYKPNGAIVSLSALQIATGLYKIPYTIPGNQTGTYTLVVTVSYVTDTVESNGTSFKCFLVSSTLELMNNKVIEIQDGLALVQKDLGFVKLNLTAMNVTLQGIFLKVISINGTTALIQTSIGVMNGTINGINGKFATIVVPGFDQITTDISSLMGTQESWTIPQYATLIIALVAAVASTLSLLLFMRRKKPAAPTETK